MARLSHLSHTLLTHNPPGGSQQGSVFISTRDVAQMMAGTVGHQNALNRIIEAGGPEWITWAEVAELLAKKIDRNVRTLPIPAWFAGIGQSIVQPIMPFAIRRQSS